MSEPQRLADVLPMQITAGLTRGADGKLRPSPEVLAEAARREAEQAALTADPDYQRQQAELCHRRAMAYLAGRGFPKLACQQATWEQLGRAAGTIRKWAARRPLIGLVLDGPVGCGKTYAATLAATLVPRERDFVAAADLITALRDSSEAQAVRQWRDSELLVLDDLGAEEAMPDYLRGLFGAFLDARYRDGRPTIITTNRVDAEQRYGQRVASRLADSSAFQRIAWRRGSDRRSER